MQFFIKLISITIIIFVSGCSDLSKQEKSLVGYWQWQENVDGFSEKGFIHLRKDRSYLYKIESTNPTESLVQEKGDYSNIWRLNNNKVCTSTHWRDAGWFSKAKVFKEDCFWQVSQDKNGEFYLTINGGFIQKSIRAYRKTEGNI